MFRLSRLAGTVAAGLFMALPVMAGRLSTGLESYLGTLRPTDELRVLVSLQNQADVASLDTRLRAERSTLARRHREVLELLQATAASTQGPLLQELENLKSQGKVLGYTPHWLVNAVVVRGTAALIPTLADLPGVEQVEVDLVPELIAPVSVLDAGEGDGSEREIGLAPGVAAVQADRVWHELGITGQGALVANMDTGVNRNHEALSARWRGNIAPASQCWQDAWGASTTPTDGNGHGSHTMGTITGLASGDSVGVCPGALWIATNVIAGGTGSAFDNAVIAGFEWLADPDNNPATTEDVPDVVQNSWGVNEQFSGYTDCDSRWWTAIDNCEAAGVCVTWSAGNEGPTPTSLRSPGDRATTAVNCFSVGSVAYTAPYTISSFSSRGPSGCGGLYSMKPEVVAPGANIYSCSGSNNTGYVYMDGTSMAGPHVAGVVGLMRSANPDLDVTSIKNILMETATPLGTPGEDNTYGWGLVNAFAAVQEAMTSYGTVEGTVRGPAGLPLAGALVREVGGDRQDTTDELGAYSIMMPAGTYSLSASAYGHQAQTQAVEALPDNAVTLNFTLAAVPSAQVAGQVRDADGLPMQGAIVSVTGPGMPVVEPVMTPIDGSFAFTLPVGQAITVRSQGSPLPEAVAMGPDGHGYFAYDLADGDYDMESLTVAAGGHQLILRGQNRVSYDWTTLDPEQGGPGTALTFTLDDQTFPVTLPFTFRFYGQDYTQVSVCGNGWVAMGSTTSTDYSNTAIPNVDGPSAMLAPAWEDYSPQQAVSGNISTWHDTTQGRFIIEYNHIRQFNPTSAFESFQVILLDPELHPTQSGDGAMIFQYGEVNNVESVTVGIENAAQTDGLQYLISSTETGAEYGEGCQTVQAGLAILFTTGLLPSTIVSPVADLRIESLPSLQQHLVWTPRPGAISYRVERAGLDGQWTVLGETVQAEWVDGFVLGTRLYRVVALYPE